MKITNKQFGEFEFSKENILHFKNGLFGFEEYKSFLLIKSENDLFFWLNSVDQPELIFPLVGLRVIDDSYPQNDETEAFGIVTLNSDPNNTTVNLKAPVYINQDKKEGFQTIIDHDKYMVNYKLFVED
ncbi:MAG: flagellar biosynthesis protein FliW [Ignavibacteriales bacterium]|jgi:flagellar assembly factor FliW|nr:flagellar assembly protein FliW [Melioribacteraceae bacterium]RJP63139.1 MAG: flagellar biosynthesis protein FliW [Ignavibacteriales bacterium]